MSDSEPETEDCCKNSCCKNSCCKKLCCSCDCCGPCNFKEFLKRKYGRVLLVLLGWAATICFFIVVKDKDWNMVIVPYLFAIVASALVSVLCERGHYNHERLGDIYRFEGGRRQHGNLVFRDEQDSEVSPLLSGARRDVSADIPRFRADLRPLEHAEELFEPAPVVFQGSNEGPDVCQRDSQVTVQADVHRPVQDPPSPKILSPERPGESSSSASGSDPHNSSTTPDSGVALKSTAQSTPTASGGPRPPPPNTEEPQKDPISPVEKSTRF